MHARPAPWTVSLGLATAVVAAAAVASTAPEPPAAAVQAAELPPEPPVVVVVDAPVPPPRSPAVPHAPPPAIDLDIADPVLAVEPLDLPDTFLDGCPMCGMG